MATGVNTCLEFLFGLSRTTCDCYNDNKPNDADKSISGLFLDEIEGGISLAGIKSLGNACSEMWAMMGKARDEALKRIGDDITIAANMMHKAKRTPFSGQVCQKSGVLPLSLSSGYAATRFRTNYLKDGYLIVNNLWVYMNMTATFDIVVYKTYRDCATAPVVVHTFQNVNSTANQLASVTIGTPLELPLYDEMGSPIDYSFVYQLAGGMQPYDNKVSCNCGGDEMTMKQYMDVSGISGNSIDTLRQWSVNAQANGLVFGIDIKCMAKDLLCRNMKLNEDIAITAAWASRFKAAELLIEYVLGSNTPTQFTLSNREYLWGKRNHFQKEYNNRVQWIAENIDVSGSGCYACIDNRMVKGSIAS